MSQRFPRNLNRRRFLAGAATGVGLTAGCAALRGEQPDREVYYVGTDGDDSNPGSRDAPVEHVQTALDRAMSGDTVHVLPGRYQERVQTVRSGEPEAPITITGPTDAVFVGGDETEKPNPLMIHHSHIHLTGLTFDGLQNPDKPEEPDSYARSLISVRPEEVVGISSRDERTWTAGDPPYLTDIRVRPHAVGNAQRSLVGFKLTNDVDIGGFEVIGPAGVLALHGDRDTHNGEIVYVGVPFPNLPNFGLSTLDASHDYRIHHIDNSAGHQHAELVDLKPGVHDVTVEYCTDAGGAASYSLSKQSRTSEDAMNLGGNDATVRWCVVENSHGQGIGVGNAVLFNREKFEAAQGFELPDGAETVGTNNAIYGNRIADCDGLAIQYPTDGDTIPEAYGPDGQRVVCGNDIDGATHGTPRRACPGDTPTGDGIGHTGGTPPTRTG